MAAPPWMVWSTCILQTTTLGACMHHVIPEAFQPLPPPELTNTHKRPISPLISISPPGPYACSGPGWGGGSALHGRPHRVELSKTQHASSSDCLRSGGNMSAGCKLLLGATQAHHRLWVACKNDHNTSTCGKFKGFIVVNETA